MSQSLESSPDPRADECDIATFKDYLSGSHFRIRLDDLVNASVRSALSRMSDQDFPPSTPTITGEQFIVRLAAYGEAVRTLQLKAALLGKWASPEHLPTLTNLIARIAEHSTNVQSGNSLWLNLRLYPVSLLQYSAGIGSLAADNYGAFAANHMTRINARTRRTGNKAAAVVVPVIEAMTEVASTGMWREIEGYKQKRVPDSEYLFSALRPVLDDLLFLGASYEYLFDRYEVLRALMYADATDGSWGPVGRFACKYCQRGESNPYSALYAEAAEQKDNWGPFRAGIFRGTYARFHEVATRFEKELLQRLPWS